MHWDDNWTRALVTVVAASVGAVFAGLFNMYAANKGIKEVKLQYEYKLRDGYLDNARKFIGDVYVPLSIALTRLFKNYERYAATLEEKDAGELASTKNEFETDCRNYVQTVDELLDRGADAYLTTALDQRLNEFTNFIRNSIVEKEIRKRRVVETRFNMFGLTTSPKIVAESAANSWASRVRMPDISVGFLGMGFVYSEKTLAAPTETREFELRIRTEIPQIKFLIKEVTLGSSPARN